MKDIQATYGGKNITEPQLEESSAPTSPVRTHGEHGAAHAVLGVEVRHRVPARLGGPTQWMPAQVWPGRDSSPATLQPGQAAKQEQAAGARRRLNGDIKGLTAPQRGEKVQLRRRVPARGDGRRSPARSLVIAAPILDFGPVLESVNVDTQKPMVSYTGGRTSARSTRPVNIRVLDERFSTHLRPHTGTRQAAEERLARHGTRSRSGGPRAQHNREPTSPATTAPVHDDVPPIIVTTRSLPEPPCTQVQCKGTPGEGHQPPPRRGRGGEEREGTRPEDGRGPEEDREGIGPGVLRAGAGEGAAVRPRRRAALTNQAGEMPGDRGVKSKSRSPEAAFFRRLGVQLHRRLQVRDRSIRVTEARLDARGVVVALPRVGMLADRLLHELPARARRCPARRMSRRRTHSSPRRRLEDDAPLCADREDGRLMPPPRSRRAPCPGEHEDEPSGLCVDSHTESPSVNVGARPRRTTYSLLVAVALESARFVSLFGAVGVRPERGDVEAASHRRVDELTAVHGHGLKLVDRARSRCATSIHLLTPRARQEESTRSASFNTHLVVLRSRPTR